MRGAALAVVAALALAVPAAARAPHATPADGDYAGHIDGRPTSVTLKVSDGGRTATDLKAGHRTIFQRAHIDGGGFGHGATFGGHPVYGHWCDRHHMKGHWTETLGNGRRVVLHFHAHHLHHGDQGKRCP